MSEVSDGIHTSHCCHKHGCKYGAGLDCVVESGLKRQEFPCEFCDEDAKDENETADAIIAWLEGRVKELREMDTRIPGYIRQSAYDRADHYEDVVRGIRERAWKK
jgi:hypothetical protein